MPSFGSSMQWFRILKEIDLREIQREGTGGFRLIVTGEPEASERLWRPIQAAAGGGPAVESDHPWIMRWSTERIQEEALGGAGHRDVVLVVHAGKPSAHRGKASGTPTFDRLARRLESEGIPWTDVVLDDAAYQAHIASDGEREEGEPAILPSLPGDVALRDHLGPVLMEAIPDEDLRVAIAREVPPYRAAAVASIIEDTARANAAYSATTGLAELLPALVVPLTAADVIVLTKNQLIMAYRIALMAGKKGRPTDVMVEMFSVVGGGLFFRQVARELVGLIPLIGWLPKVAVAYGGTKVIGTAVQRWAMQGEVVGADEIKTLRKEALRAGKRVASELRERMVRDEDAEDRAGLSAGRTPMDREHPLGRTVRAPGGPPSSTTGQRARAPRHDTTREGTGRETAAVHSGPANPEPPPAAGDPIPMPDGDPNDPPRRS